MATDIVRTGAGSRIMDEWATGRLIDWAAGAKAAEVTKEALRKEILGVASELAGPDPIPVERMLAEAAAVAWFALRLHEAQFVAGSTSEKGLTIAQSEFHQRRIDRAHRRYLATLRSLATVRKLALPSVQINLARQQLNVAGGPALPCPPQPSAGREAP